MANSLYSKGRQGFLDGSIDWDTDDIRVVLVDLADYVVDLAVHEFLSSVPALARVAVSASLTAKTATDGVADAADITFTSVTGDVSEALVIYKHTGTDTTSRLIAYIDTATGLPVTPDGGNITVAWDGAADRIFRL
ncbi:MAG: hypothetical protein ACR2HR_03180 [Euzebya sp.]